jgi:hypothetical protein
MFDQFIKLSGEEKILFLEALFLLYCSKIILLVLPFNSCLKLLNPANEKLIHGEVDFLIKIKKAVRRANRLAFWKNICLVKSFAARFMLQRRGIGSEMFLGLQFKNEKELIAHAWLVSGEIEITPKMTSKFKEIYKI